ncbi:MAG: nucleotide sugar dehydrogenase [Blastocatellia bacterium]
MDKISAREARVGVVGLGYVGLPLAVEFAREGFNSTGFEVDAKKADTINRGESYIPDVNTAHVAEMVEAKRLSATTDFARLKDQDVIIICVPTPLRKTKDPDVSYILAASEKIQACLRPGQLIILESTTYPGTTDEVLKPMFDATGLKLDEDYFLAFSPERVDPGNENFNTKNIVKVVGGVTETSAEVAAAVYGAIVDKVHPVSSARVAEACKLLENTFRAVNIGLVNELARLCDTLGIDTWEVIAAAATKPFGFMPFYPGPGIGGHCLVGDEAVVIRTADDSRKRLTLFETLFDKLWDDPQTKKLEADGADVIPEPRLDALSLNTETNLPEWRPVSYLFRRLYQGNLVTITTSDNRRLTVTEMHPMLVVDADGRAREVLAKALALGDRLPIHCSSAMEPSRREGRVADEKLDLLPLLPAEIAAKVETLKGLFRGDGDVYVKVGEQSYRKNGRDYITHSATAEVGFFSSSPELFQQTIYLLQDFGFTPTFKRTKPHLQLKGYEQLLRVRDWLGPKGARLKNYFAESRRANASRTFKSAGSLTTVPVKSVEITKTDQPVYVYSIEIEGTHTFVTSYGIYVHNCIPLDPHYLSWKARMHGFEARFISLAEEVNSRMPDHVVDLVTRGLNNHRKPVNGSKVLVIGVAYKRDIDDMRESPALGIIEKLQSLGADVQFHDPYVEEIHLEGNGHQLRGIELSGEAVSEADCVVIVTDHRKINYAWLTERARLVVDTRNATRGLSDFEEKIIRL